MKKQKNHYIQAAFLSSFGSATGDSPRKARVFLRSKDPSRQNRLTSVENGCRIKGLYDIQEPPPGISSRVVDEFWTETEPQMLSATKPNNFVNLDSEAEGYLLAFLSATNCRHPDFGTLNADKMRVVGMEPPTQDEIQLSRVHSIIPTMERLAEWRWRVLYRPPEAARFIYSDMGSCRFAQRLNITDNKTIKVGGIFFPLSPDYGVLGFAFDPIIHTWKPARFQESFTLCPSAVDWINSAMWADARIEILGHPDDAEYILSLGDPYKFTQNRLGPFWGTSVGWYTDRQ